MYTIYQELTLTELQEYFRQEAAKCEANAYLAFSVNEQHQGVAYAIRAQDAYREYQRLLAL